MDDTECGAAYGATALYHQLDCAPIGRRASPRHRRLSACSGCRYCCTHARGCLSGVPVRPPYWGHAMNHNRTNRTRILYHLARADFLERVRRYSFLVTLGLAVYLGYLGTTGQIFLNLGKYQAGRMLGLLAKSWRSQPRCPAPKITRMRSLG